MRILVGQAHLPSVPANLVSIAACSLLNSLVSYLVVFRPPGRPIRAWTWGKSHTAAFK